MKIYDMLGREVATLVNEQKVPGRYEVQFNGADYASGVYVYQLTVTGTSKEYKSLKKFVLMK